MRLASAIAKDVGGKWQTSWAIIGEPFFFHALYVPRFQYFPLNGCSFCSQSELLQRILLDSTFVYWIKARHPSVFDNYGVCWHSNEALQRIQLTKDITQLSCSDFDDTWYICWVLRNIRQSWAKGHTAEIFKTSMVMRWQAKIFVLITTQNPKLGKYVN